MGNKLFNTPFELSLHAVMLLDVSGAKLTIDRITAYDFIAIYCEDFGVADRSLNGENGFASVSYTHLDVYKRQRSERWFCGRFCI